MRNQKTKDMILCAMFVALTAAGAYIKIPIPVMPITLQTLFTTLAGLLLGGRRGAISVGAYVFLGLAGLPIFTQGGGIGYIFQPSFGYLIGFIVGTYVTGKIANRVENPSYRRLLGASFAGIGVVYLIGMIYCYLIRNYYMGTPMGLSALFFYCFVLTAPGDIVLCFVSAALGKRLIPMIRSGRL